jgi:hypothetical protein
MGWGVLKTMRKMSRRGVVYAALLLICFYLSNYTVLGESYWALGAMILLVLFMDGFLWPELAPRWRKRRQTGAVEIIPKGSVCRIPETAVNEPLRKQIASQASPDTASNHRASGGS